MDRDQMRPAGLHLDFKGYSGHVGDPSRDLQEQSKRAATSINVR